MTVSRPRRHAGPRPSHSREQHHPQQRRHGGALHHPPCAIHLHSAHCLQRGAQLCSAGLRGAPPTAAGFHDVRRQAHASTMYGVICASPGRASALHAELNPAHGPSTPATSSRAGVQQGHTPCVCVALAPCHAPAALWHAVPAIPAPHPAPGAPRSWCQHLVPMPAPTSDAAAGRGRGTGAGGQDRLCSEWPLPPTGTSCNSSSKLCRRPPSAAARASGAPRCCGCWCCCQASSSASP
jgi:hypothetical protein